MPFGEVMYRCNAHYCFGMFRNRAVGLLTTLALMQLFLFSFYLNGLHNQGVVDRSGEQLQQSLVASSVFVDTSVSKNAEGGDGEPVKVSTQQHQPQPESAPRHVDGPGKVNVNQLADLLNKSSKNPKVDALQMFAKASLADRDGPFRGLGQLGQRLLTDNNGSAQGVGDAAMKVLVNVFDNKMDTKKYGDLAKLGMQLLNGLQDQAKQTAVSGMMETAAQLMMPQKTPLENAMAKSAIGLLTGALGNQKMDTMSVLNIAAKMFQANRPDDRGAASPMNLLNKLVGSAASQTPLAPSADQYQLYSDYVKYSRKRSTRRKLDKVPLRFNYASGQACSAANTYVFLVVSTARQSSRRQVARESWMTILTKDPRFAVRFLIGQPDDSDRDRLAVDSESRLHNDIIEVDVKESSSFSSTLKTLAALEWAQANCPSVRSVLKIQDDIYINPSKMIQVLDDYLNTSSIIGNIAGPAAPGLKVSQDVWPWKTYPNHLLGGCYMIGKEAVARVLAVARTTPIMSAEDIFITGLCAIGGKVDIVNDKSLFNGQLIRQIDACTLQDYASWMTAGSEDVAKTWKSANSVIESGQKCSTKKCARGRCLPS